MRRRDFIAGLAGTAAWPAVARAQQGARVRRIGILEVGDELDRANQARWDATRERLARLGWIEGRNARFEVRFSANDPDRMRVHADELVRLAPDVIAVASATATRALLQRTHTIPIVFTNVGDPVAMGLLKNIARPEGNATGITSLFQSLGGKWLELLKEAAPRTARVPLIFAPEIVSDQYFDVMDKAAEALALKTIRTPYRNAAELERAIANFAAEPNGGLLMVPPPPTPSNRELINRLAIKYRLPTNCPGGKQYAAEGCMMSYGSDTVELNETAAIYIDRILRGAKVSELPVQFPTKLQLVINLQTTKSLGLDLPYLLQQRADELIE
jgi:putative tryptophan/tyrosine transport system substrate-binding protein